ncbi:MAG: hypothetical protein WBD30_03625 [Bacteroidota bacterium]
MYDETAHSFCSEFYTVEKTLEVVVHFQGESIPVRIDALKNEISGGYTTCARKCATVTIQPTFPKENETFLSKPEEFSVWVEYNMPDTHGNTAEKVLRQALGFLRTHVSE